MRIGKLEIRWAARLGQGYGVVRPVAAATGEDDLSGALAVPDTDRQWLAVHQVIDEAEDECQRAGRAQVANARMCVNSLGMADGAALVRTKLAERRLEALKIKH